MVEGVVDEPVETVDSRRIAERGRGEPPAASASSPKHRLRSGLVDIADVPVTFDESVILLDVREDDEWARGHAAARNTFRWATSPHGWVSSTPAAVRGVPRRRSITAVAQYLARNGYEPINVNGGMLAWAGAVIRRHR
jgi:rhodanese-related sulfurtransferase